MSEKMLSDRLRPNIECAPWVIEEVKRLEAALRTHENGGQESEAGAGAVAHDGECAMMDSDENFCTCGAHDSVSSWSPPPSAPAIEAAAIMRAAELMVERGVLSRDGTDYQALRALIPQDGRTALEELINEAVAETYRTFVSPNPMTPELTAIARAIVTNLIVVPPLNSESVSGEGDKPIYSAFASNDREMLLYLMQAFETESWQCPCCGHAEDTATMDSAGILRDYLSAHRYERGETK